MAYRERPAGMPGVVLWERSTATGPARSRILPDGCLDLIWDGGQLTVAGPDLIARWHDSQGGTAYTALRFHAGTGPAALGVPASELAGLSPALDGVWARAAARRLAERVAGDPAGPAAALAAWAAEAVAAGDGVDPVGPRVHALAGRGVPVAAMADILGLSERQLRRRCLPLFGYGPRRLARILRMNRAVAAALDGRPLADVAFGCGYADQAHLSRDLLDLSGTTPTSLLAELGLTADGRGPARARRRLARGEHGEQVDRRAVRVVDDGVPHAPEGIPRGQVALVAGPGQLGVRRVDPGRAVAAEGQGHAVAGTGGRAGPAGIERPDRLLGVEGDPQAAPDPDVHVRLLVGVGRDVQAETAVKGQGRGHVRDHQLDEGQLKVHDGDASPGPPAVS